MEGCPTLLVFLIPYINATGPIADITPELKLTFGRKGRHDTNHRRIGALSGNLQENLP